MGNTGTVDEHAQRPDGAHLGNGVDAVVGGEVGDEGLDGDLAERGFELLQAFLAAANRDHVKAVGGQLFGIGFADSG